MADKRNAVIFCQIAFNLQPAYGVGAVQYNKFFSVFGGSFHGKSHSADICERTAADVLYVIYQYIDVFQHFRGRFACLAVEGINGQPGGGVFYVGHMVACMYIAAHAMFRTIKGYEVHVRCFMQNVYGGL